jgi:hypothetical protein
VAVEIEKLVELVLGGAHVGQDALCRVGEQDPFAERSLFHHFAVLDVHMRLRPQVGWIVADESARHDVGDPKGFADRGDVGLHRDAGSTGFAASEASTRPWPRPSNDSTNSANAGFASG